MKATYTERAVFYMQELFLKMMYKKYWGYLVVLLVLSLLFPFITVWTRLSGYAESYWGEMADFYGRMPRILYPSSYRKNKEHVESTVELKRKEL